MSLLGVVCPKCTGQLKTQVQDNAIELDILTNYQCSKCAGSVWIAEPVRKFSLFLTGSLNW